MKRRILFHSFLWLTILLLATVFRLSKLGFNDAVTISAFNISVYIIVFYFNSLFIFPKYYNGKKLTNFVLLNVGFIFLMSVLYLPFEIKYIEVNFDVIRKPLIIFFLRNFFASLLIVSIHTVFLFQEKIKERELASEHIIGEKLQAELMLLKSQINPHFLFNALNNIYSLSYLKSDKAPESVLLLSNMLRYIIEDCKEEALPLRSEIDYLETFISFQKIRTAGELDVSFEHSEVKSDQLISPLIFLPFVENSFKYSRVGEVKDSFVKILLKSTENKSIYFEIENSMPSPFNVSPGAGTGLANVKKRLNLVYPDKHDLQIDKQNNTYKVVLKIDFT